MVAYFAGVGTVVAALGAGFGGALWLTDTSDVRDSVAVAERQERAPDQARAVQQTTTPTEPQPQLAQPKPAEPAAAPPAQPAVARAEPETRPQGEPPAAAAPPPAADTPPPAGPTAATSGAAPARDIAEPPAREAAEPQKAKPQKPEQRKAERRKKPKPAYAQRPVIAAPPPPARRSFDPADFDDDDRPALGYAPPRDERPPLFGLFGPSPRFGPFDD